MDNGSFEIKTGEYINIDPSELMDALTIAFAATAIKFSKLLQQMGVGHTLGDILDTAITLWIQYKQES